MLKSRVSPSRSVFIIWVFFFGASLAWAGKPSAHHWTQRQSTPTELTIWDANPKELNKQTLYLLSVHLSELALALQIENPSVFFNPVAHEKLVIQLVPGSRTSIHLKTKSRRGYQSALGERALSSQVFQNRFLTVTRLLEFVEDFVKRGGSVFNYLPIADVLSLSMPSQVFQGIYPKTVAEPLALVTYLYLLKTPDGPLIREDRDTMGERDDLRSRNRFKKALEKRVASKVFDPAFARCETNQLQQILTFYQNAILSVETGEPNAQGNRISFDPDLNLEERLGFLHQAWYRVKTELAIRNFFKS